MTDIITRNLGLQSYEPIWHAMQEFTNTRDADTRDIPVIFVTTRKEETDRIWGMRQGATDYVTKPVDPEHLQNAITNAVAA